MNKKDTQYFKVRLEKEKKLLEDQLDSVGKSSTKNSTEWEATATKIEIDSADENEVADKMEELEENELIMKQLEKQLRDVNDALSKMGKGTYGICEISGELIEKERLEANPSARTSMKYMK